VKRSPSPSRSRRIGRAHLAEIFAVLALIVTMVVGTHTGPTGAAVTPTTTPATSSHANARYPVGIPSSTEPSGEAPPGAQALPGYRQTYVQDFQGATVPEGWFIYAGIPSPGGHFGISHVVFRSGLMELMTYRDPNWGDRWVTGGICQCGASQVYGAYFVRSRITGSGPNEVELLWPLTNKWPPEIDFSETGDKVTGTTSSVHFGVKNTVVRRSVKANMKQWHTWGVIWTRSSITYTLDGRVWGVFTQGQDIPRVRMTLDVEQVTHCPSSDCPTAQQNMYVDWVAVYTK
jgi:hypothetical protein